MVLESILTWKTYWILSSSFGISTYHTLYKKARNQALEAVNREKEDRVHNFINFSVWTVMVTITAPLLLLATLIKDNVVGEMKDKLVERFIDEDIA